MSLRELTIIETNWKAQTSKGNQLYKDQNFNAALNHYKNAHIMSDILFKNLTFASQNDIPVIKQFSVSCANVANSFWVLNDLKGAGDYLFYNVWYLKLLTRRPGLDEELLFQAISEWKKAVIAIVDFHIKTGQQLSLDFWEDETYDQILNTRKVLTSRKTILN